MLPSLATAVAGVGALWLLDRWATAGAAPATDSSGPSTGPSRRGVLIGVGVLAATAAVMGGAGRWIGVPRPAHRHRLPEARRAGAGVPDRDRGDFPGVTLLRVPTDDFYRVDTRLDVPIVDIDGWSLTIDGMVDKRLELTFDDLLADAPHRARHHADLRLQQRRRTVRRRRPLDRRPPHRPPGAAGVQGGVDQIFSTDVDGMTIGTPYELAIDGRDAMIALGTNARPSLASMGTGTDGVLGLDGFISACKWIERITPTTYAAEDPDRTKATGRRTH